LECEFLAKLFAVRDALRTNFLKSYVWNDPFSKTGWQIKLGFSVNQLSTQISPQEAKKALKTYRVDLYSKGWFDLEERDSDTNQNSWYLYDFEENSSSLHLLFKNQAFETEFKVIVVL